MDRRKMSLCTPLCGVVWEECLMFVSLGVSLAHLGVCLVLHLRGVTHLITLEVTIEAVSLKLREGYALRVSWL